MEKIPDDIPIYNDREKNLSFTFDKCVFLIPTGTLNIDSWKFAETESWKFAEIIFIQGWNFADTFFPQGWTLADKENF